VPAAGIDPATTFPVVSYDYSGPGQLNWHADVRSSGFGCNSGEFTVNTSDDSGNYRDENFSFVIPWAGSQTDRAGRRTGGPRSSPAAWAEGGPGGWTARLSRSSGASLRRVGNGDATVAGCRDHAPDSSRRGHPRMR